MINYVENSNDLESLVEQLQSPSRKKPVCIVSMASQDPELQFDVKYIEDDCGSVAELYVVESGTLTRALQGRLPEDCHVFGAAARTYGASFFSKGKSEVGPLHYPTPVRNKKQEVERLIGELWAFAESAGLLKKPEAAVQVTSAKVEAIFGAEVAILVLANGAKVSLRAELAFPGVPLDKILSVGQKVTGYFDESSKSFRLEQRDFSVGDLISAYGYNTVTLGLIRSADRKAAEVAVHPGLAFSVSKAEITGNPLDVVDRYLKVGEVYPFRIYLDPQGKTRLRCDDIDDSEPILPALTLLPGGEPWLVEGRGVLGDDVATEAQIFEETIFEEVDLSGLGLDQAEEAENQSPFAKIAKNSNLTLPAAPKVLSAKQLSLHQFTIANLQSKIMLLKNQNEVLTNENKRFIAEINGLAKTNQTLKEDAIDKKRQIADFRQAERARSGDSKRDPWESLDRFDEMGDWFQFELQNSWIESFSFSERKEYPLTDNNWTVGDNFFDNFSPGEFNAVQLRKVFRTVTQLVTGYVEANNSRERHELHNRSGKPILREADGGQAMRMYVEEQTASARRLHYWALPGRKFELSQIATHDEYGIN